MQRGDVDDLEAAAACRASGLTTTAAAASPNSACVTSWPRSSGRRLDVQRRQLEAQHHGRTTPAGDEVGDRAQPGDRGVAAHVPDERAAARRGPCRGRPRCGCRGRASRSRCRRRRRTGRRRRERARRRRARRRPPPCPAAAPRTRSGASGPRSTSPRCVLDDRVRRPRGGVARRPRGRSARPTRSPAKCSAKAPLPDVALLEAAARAAPCRGRDVRRRSHTRVDVLVRPPSIPRRRPIAWNSTAVVGTGTIATVSRRPASSRASRAPTGGYPAAAARRRAARTRGRARRGRRAGPGRGCPEAGRPAPARRRVMATRRASAVAAMVSITSRPPGRSSRHASRRRPRQVGTCSRISPADDDVGAAVGQRDGRDVAADGGHAVRGRGAPAPTP